MGAPLRVGGGGRVGVSPPAHIDGGRRAVTGEFRRSPACQQSTNRPEWAYLAALADPSPGKASPPLSMPFGHDDLIRHFGLIWPVHNVRFCELLITLRRHFDGDLDRMLVLAVIGSRTLAWGRITGLSYSQFKALERTTLLFLVRR